MPPRADAFMIASLSHGLNFTKGLAVVERQRLHWPATPEYKSLDAYRASIGPYRFYFYSHEPNEPPHIHVDRDDLSAKFWIDPAGLARNLGFGRGSLQISRGWCRTTRRSSSRRGMTTLDPRAGERIVSVAIDEDRLSVDLADGRTIIVPLA
jgi:hypothetical protein